MSKPGDFDRLDNADRTTDRYEQFKATTAADIEYRDAYHAAAARDPRAVEGLPHPDSPVPFDYKAALERLKGGGNTVKGVPPVDLRA